jgi:hypothetical protein
MTASIVFPRWTLLLPGLLLLAGCGDGRPARVPVSGQVLLDGKPVPMGFIRVVPENGRAAAGTLDANGRFRLTTYDEGDGCILGTHGVEVLAKQRLSATQIRLLVPKRYFDVATSGLTVTIDKETDSLKVELVSHGQKPVVETTETSGDATPGVPQAH